MGLLRHLMTAALYNDDFYSRHGDRALQSARTVVPLLTELATIRSVIDVGCGIGGWLRAFSENGVQVIRGLDGNYVDQSRLYIAPECFSVVELNKPLDIDGSYDLAVCLEVAEHLDIRSGIGLVNALTGIAPLILFSAAVPGQGGIRHVNEQWPGYWRRLFEQRQFRMLDVIRPLIRENCHIDWWYRQNIVLFATEAAIVANPQLRDSSKDCSELEWIHINMIRPPHAGVRNVLVHLWPLLGQAIRNHLPDRYVARSRTATTEDCP
jgi:SAM-dependent methyltransferase